MKKLEKFQMENLNGGLSGTLCFFSGLGSFLVLTPLSPTFYLGVASVGYFTKCVTSKN